jgi:hypothetical protein
MNYLYEYQYYYEQNNGSNKIIEFKSQLLSPLKVLLS